jgi:methyl-accepting chemotaxis protein
MADVDPIVLQISSDFADVKKDLANLRKDLKKTGNETGNAAKKFLEFDRSLSTIKIGYGKLAAAATAAAAAIALTTHAVGEEVKELKLLSRRLGISTKDLSKLSAVAKNFGIDTETLADGIKDLNVKIADANTGAKGYQDMLRQLGLNYRELKDLDPTQQFYVFADAIKKAGGSLARFGLDEINDAMFQMGPLMQKGGKEIKRLADEAERMGRSFSQEQIDEMSDYNASVRKVSIAFGQLSKAVAEQAAPVMSDLAELIADSVDGLADVISQSTKLMKALKETRVAAEASAKAFEEQKVIASSAGITMSSLADHTTEYTDSANSMNEALEQSRQVFEGTAKALDPFGEKLKQGKLDLEGMTTEIKSLSTNELFESMLGTPNQGAAGDALAKALEKEDAKKEAMEEYRKAELNRMFEFELEKGEIAAEAAALELAEHQAWLDREFGAEAKHADRMKKLWDHGLKGRLKVTQHVLGQMTSLMGSESRKMFEIGKAAAIAQATIDTYQSANSSFAAGSKIGGPPVGAAFAAVAVAAGIANVQRIASTSMGRGGAGAGGGAAAASGGASAADAGGQGGEPANVLDATFNIQGTSVSKDQIRTLGSELNELSEDGFKLRSVTVI